MDGQVDLDGVTLRWTSWPGRGDTVVLVHHGLGEHGGRWSVLAEALAGLPVTVATYDLRGHGVSSGPRGDADGMAQLAGDLERMLPAIVAALGARRVLIYGHSLGAGVVAHALIWGGLQQHVVGAVLSAPPVGVPLNFAARVKIGVGRLIRGIAPSIRLANEIDPTALSHDDGQVARYVSDPLVHAQVSIRLGLSIVDTGPRLVEDAGRITVPTLVFVGTEDRVVDPPGVARFAARLGSADRSFCELAGCRHEPHFERADLAAAWREVVRGWVARQVGAA